MNPIKPSAKTEFLPILVLIFSIGLAIYGYAHFPDRVPIHWNLAGDVDGYSGRALGAWLFPAMITGIYLLFLLLPIIDPKREHYASSRTAYHGIKNSILTFLFGFQIFMALAGLGYDVPIEAVVPIGVGLLFITIGHFLQSVKQNWIMGVRTPWTMESERVWEKTNELMSYLMMVAGVIIAACAFPFPDIFKAGLFIATIVIMVVTPIVYSYFAYQQERKHSHK